MSKPACPCESQLSYWGSLPLITGLVPLRETCLQKHSLFFITIARPCSRSSLKSGWSNVFFFFLPDEVSLLSGELLNILQSPRFSRKRRNTQLSLYCPWRQQLPEKMNEALKWTPTRKFLQRNFDRVWLTICTWSILGGVGWGVPIKITCIVFADEWLSQTCINSVKVMRWDPWTLSSWGQILWLHTTVKPDVCLHQYPTSSPSPMPPSMSMCGKDRPLKKKPCHPSTCKVRDLIQS